MNSLILLILFTCFIAFGYISLGRVIHKLHFTNNSGSRISKGHLAVKITEQLGYSAVFYSLPAISISLFWGWVPALLWLIVSHLLIEVIINYQLTLKPEYQVLENLPTTQSKVISLLTQLYLMFSAAITTVWLTQLIDAHSGMLFFLFFLVLAQTTFQGTNQNNSTQSLIGNFVAIVLLVLGLIFSQQLGIVFHGDWAPFAKILPWISFNNASVIAMIIIVAGWLLSANNDFRNDLGRFAGSLIILLLILMILKLVILRPELDAPLHNSSQSEFPIPTFLGLCLILLSSTIGPYLKTLAMRDDDHQRQTLISLQSSSLITALFLIIVLCTLAAAIGIGAWNTHYLQWSNNLDLTEHFKLALRSLLSLITGNTQTMGLVGMAIIASLSTIALSIILFTFHQFKVDETEQPRQALDYLKPITLILFTLFLLWHGITLNVWLIFGILNWLLVTHYLCNSNLNPLPWETQSPIFSCAGLLLAGVGTIQTCVLVIYWISQQQIIWATIAILLFGFGGYLLYQPCLRLIQGLKNGTKTNLIR